MWDNWKENPINVLEEVEKEMVKEIIDNFYYGINMTLHRPTINPIAANAQHYDCQLTIYRILNTHRKYFKYLLVDFTFLFFFTVFYISGNVNEMIDCGWKFMWLWNLNHFPLYIP